ncbi:MULTISPECIES: dihydropteroate synthase [Bacteroides]|uniref:dihydropteroate synthase n=1 Tax=Bacteroides TaxID=816 RepID=UPI001DCE553F|nr:MULTISPECIES: dihydropteroate synthase [Bacteroides]HJD92602.1 dihydropteroate synthase [Bacteroides coprosuis]
MKSKAPKYINVNGKLMDLAQPQVMGILNVTPDSFYAASRKHTELDIKQRALQIIDEGGTIIDVGAYSSRPNAKHITTEEEMDRLHFGLKIINETIPNAVISVDTFRADVARMCVEEHGVAIINDIATGQMDENMFETISDLNVPYIIMHMQGTPQTMQKNPHYDNLLKEVLEFFAHKVGRLQELGVKDIILDPGFGFGKTVTHNYELLAALDEFSIFDLPILVGVSRKSMIYNLLDISPDEALNGTSVINALSLERGANILRVHDVKEAVEVVRIINKMKESDPIQR